MENPGGTRSKGNVQPAPSWRSLDLKGPNFERYGPEAQMYLRSGPITCCHLCGLLWCLREDGPEWGLTKQHNGPRSARAPTLFVSLYMRKQKFGKGPRGGDKGVLCRRCTRQSLLQQAACTLANLTRGEVSSLLLHEPPQLGAAPPTHLIGWGSMHFDCYGPNKCGCVTISMPNPFRDRGPTCALGHRGRAPTERNPKRGHRTSGI